MVVSKEQALKEVHEWLDYKRVKQSDRETKEAEKQIEELANLVSDGTIVINSDTKEIEQTLLFPFGKEIEVNKITYKPRINAGSLQRAMAGTKNDDLQGMIIAHGSAVTGLTKNQLQALDTEDYKALKSIVVFFM